MFRPLEHHHAGAFTENRAASGDIERSTRQRTLGRCEDSRRLEDGEHFGVQWRIRAASDDYIGDSRTNFSPAFEYCHRPRCAPRRQGEHRAMCANLLGEGVTARAEHHANQIGGVHALAKTVARAGALRGEQIARWSE